MNEAPSQRKTLKAAPIALAVVFSIAAVVVTILHFTGLPAAITPQQASTPDPAITAQEQLERGDYDAARRDFARALVHAANTGDQAKAEYYRQQIDFIDSTPRPASTAPPQDASPTIKPSAK